MKTITVAGERLTAAQQEVLIAADSDTGAEFSQARSGVFDSLRKRDLIYLWKYKDERWTYRTTVLGKVIADAIEAYRKGRVTNEMVRHGSRADVRRSADAVG